MFKVKTFMIRGIFLYAIAALSILWLPTFSTAVQKSLTETDELLQNPGKGWMTMFKAAMDDKHLPPDIPSALFYLRINWASIHTGIDEYNWVPIDQAIRKAQRGGQQMMLRLMPVWHEGNSPLWMRQIGFDGYTCNLNGNKWAADLDDLRVQYQISKLLENMGNRYDGHPGVHSVEINFLGVYGEGHFNECKHIPMPSEETQNWLVDEHYRHFPNLPIIGPIDANRGKYTTKYMYRSYGQTRGAGIFLDAWGDYSIRYNHMERKYPKWLNEIHGSDSWDSWKKGIIKLEPSGVMNQWSDDVPRALSWALEKHATFIGNKNASFPVQHREVIKETLKTIGYRLVLRNVEHEAEITAGEKLKINLEFENKGVAPPYRDYYLAVRLSSPVMAKKVVSDLSVKFWLPGIHDKLLEIPVHSRLAPGTYAVAVAIVWPHDHSPAILMPIENREASGWHPVSTVIIK